MLAFDNFVMVGNAMKREGASLLIMSIRVLCRKYNHHKAPINIFIF